MKLLVSFQVTNDKHGIGDPAPAPINPREPGAMLAAERHIAEPLGHGTIGTAGFDFCAGDYMIADTPWAGPDIRS